MPLSIPERPEDLRLGPCRARFPSGPGNPKLSPRLGPCSQVLAQDPSALTEEPRSEPWKVQLWAPGAARTVDSHCSSVCSEPNPGAWSVLKVLGYRSTHLRGGQWHALLQKASQALDAVGGRQSSESI